VQSAKASTTTSEETAMTDLALKQAILDELEWEPSVDAAHIGVTVENGIVTLTGHVPTFAQKLAAEQAVKRVKGVRAVAQEIEVRLPTEHKMDDADIAKRAVSSLGWQVSVPDNRLQVLVQNGWITLRGEVDWQFQRKAAENAVRLLAGVRGVSNQISIKASEQPKDLKRRIESALARNASGEANSVRVALKDGRVTLEGKVHSWHDRKIVEDAVWAAPGVSAVEDKIQIV
jgi:osmotically-inducible protein OsmY